MPVRFGRRRTPLASPFEVRVRHVGRGVAALHALPLEARADPVARAWCLYRALRGSAEGAALERLVVEVSARIAAFESMIRSRPRLLGGRIASAELEQAVYLAIASQPLVVDADGKRFDPATFMRRVDDVLATIRRRRVAASTAPLSPGA